MDSAPPPRQALRVEVRVCAPPDEDFAQRLAGFGVPVVGSGDPVRAMMTATSPPSEDELRRHIAGLVAAQFDTVAVAAEGSDALVSTAAVWTSAGARSVASASLPAGDLAPASGGRSRHATIGPTSLDGEAAAE